MRRIWTVLTGALLAAIVAGSAAQVPDPNELARRADQLKKDLEKAKKQQEEEGKEPDAQDLARRAQELARQIEQALRGGPGGPGGGPGGGLGGALGGALGRDGPAAQVFVDRLPPNADLTPHVDFTVQRAVKFLYSRQKPDGSFSSGDYDDHAGPTALAVLALTAAGEAKTRSEIVRAVEWLKKQNIQTTYSLGLRAAALSQFGGADRDPVLRRDTQRLIAMMIDGGAHRGLYTYGKPADANAWGDLSNAQYGVLGVWYAAEAGIEIPRGYWQRVEEAWVTAQQTDGGFAYRTGRGGSYGSMTAAGIATLAITHDFLHASTAGGIQGRVQAKLSKSAAAMGKAVSWLDKYFLVDRNPGRDTSLDGAAAAPGRFRGLGNFADGSYVHYMLFGYERVGEATGQTRFAGDRWFDKGARYLIATQSGDGSWVNGAFGGTIDTAYALLFLSRGRSPVVVQKLQFDGKWNNRTRDAASMVRWLRRETERHVNWQITRLDYPFEDLRQSPILYIASDKALFIPEAQWHLLKRYLDEGGLILAADEGGGAFSASFEELLGRLYPKYVFRDIGPEHPFLAGNFPVSALEAPVRVMGNGVRELCVVLPRGDFPWRWQRTLGTVSGKSPEFSLVGNILVNITGRANLRNKGVYHFESFDPERTPAREPWTVAQLSYGGNWNPEPLAWEHLKSRLHNAGTAELRVVTLSLDDGSLRPDTKLAHLTATHVPALSTRKVASLAGYLQQGGMLLIDAAGGDADVGIWAESLLKQALPTAELRDIPTDHPIYAGLLSQAGTLTYRAAATDRVGARQAPPRLRGLFLADRLVAVVSGEDLTAGLVGYPHDGIIGYPPEASRTLATNLLRFAHTSK